MPKYFYRARSSTGELRSGTMEAKSEHELSQLLKEEGFLLISAVEEKLAGKKPLAPLLKKWIEKLLFFGKVGLKEKMFFTRNLRVMIASGISLPRSLKVLSEQTKNKKFKVALVNVAEAITKGESFSQALALHPNIFSELFQNMVRVGEEAGTLEDVLRVLASQMEKEHEVRSKILGAAIYPAVVIMAMIGIGILMLVVVVPRLAETFEELGVELPPSTKLVIGLGTFLAQKWYWVILIVVVFFFLLRILLKLNFGKRLLAGIFLKLPLISTLVKQSNSASTVRTLSSLVTSGVPIVRSLEIISRTLGNVYFREAMATAAEKVRKGDKLHQALRSYRKLYPSLVLEMVEIGEETGETASILAKLADFYEQEITSVTKNLSAIVEPLLMLLIGAVVGFFAVSMIQPMYTMLQSL